MIDTIYTADEIVEMFKRNKIEPQRFNIGRVDDVECGCIMTAIWVDLGKPNLRGERSLEFTHENGEKPESGDHPAYRLAEHIFGYDNAWQVISGFDNRIVYTADENQIAHYNLGREVAERLFKKC